MEPSVSVPMENATSPAAVPEEEPADEPDDPCFKFHGFLVTPPYQMSPIARAPIVNLQTRTAPAFSRFFTTVAVLSILWSLKGVAPHVVFVPSTARRSFTPYGIPCKGPLYFPFAISSSAFFAEAIALSSSNDITH